jgi:hypothetical protein
VNDLRKKLARLRLDLDARGGRGIELAEEIDELACGLGDCVYAYDECGWKSPESHSDAFFECERCQETLELGEQSEIEFVCRDCHENFLGALL